LDRRTAEEETMRTLLILQFRPWDDLVARVRDLLTGAGAGALGFLLAVAVALVGWVIAAVVRRASLALLRAARFNEGVHGLLGEGGPLPRHEPANVAAWAIYWVVLVTAVLFAIDSMGFELVAAVSLRLRDAVPRVVAASVLMAAGMVAALLLGAVTRRSFESAGIRGAPLRGQVVGALVTAFAALVALEQLGFATQFVMGIGIAVVAAAGLGLALAFGLGCRELARDFVVEYLRSLEAEEPKRPT
jgi:hypothetical protein